MAAAAMAEVARRQVVVAAAWVVAVHTFPVVLAFRIAAALAAVLAFRRLAGRKQVVVVAAASFLRSLPAVEVVRPWLAAAVPSVLLQAHRSPQSSPAEYWTTP